MTGVRSKNKSGDSYVDSAGASRWIYYCRGGTCSGQPIHEGPDDADCRWGGVQTETRDPDINGARARIYPGDLVGIAHSRTSAALVGHGTLHCSDCLYLDTSSRHDYAYADCCNTAVLAVA